MNLSAVAIRRPVFTVMVMTALLVLGFMGFKRLGTDLFPDVTFPVVVVNVAYPGASPNEVETLVTKEIEDAVVSLNGIDRVRSFSRESLSSTIVIFQLGVNLSDAATEVRERVAQVRHQLPNDVKEPMISRFDISAAPIMTYTLGGKRPLPELRKFAEDVIKPALEQVSGVAAVEVKGGATREIHVELDRKKLDALMLDPSIVVHQLRAANLTVPGGRFDEGLLEVSVRTLGELPDVEAVRDVIVAISRDGSTVRLRDVAEVEDGFEEVRTRVRANGDEAVSFDIRKQSGENTIAVAEAVEAKLAELQKTFPSDVVPQLIVDQSRFIKDNVHEVETAIVFGGAMAILIVLVFMLDLRSTMISAVALPTSVIGTFFAMWALGYTLNMMTLLGLSLAIGLLIDDAIVVRENISKHIERGSDPFTASLEGTKEIALAVLATTLTIVAVFMPVAFVSGIVGQFFRQFGITISVAVMLSLFVAFTLDPMLSSRFSKPHGAVDAPWAAALKRPFLAIFSAMDDAYKGALGWALRHKLIVAIAAFGSLGFTVFLAGLTGNDFMNAEDRGQFVVNLELAAGTSLDETDRLSKLAEKRLLENPELRTLYATVGPNEEANKAQWRVITSRKDERTVSLIELKDAAREAVSSVMPEAVVSVTDPPFVEGAQTEAPIMINVRGPSYDEVAPTAYAIEDILRETPGLQDIAVKYSPGRPELEVRVDRQRAADRGLSVAQVALAIRTATEGEEATKLRDGKDEIPIRVRLDERDRRGKSELSQLTMMGPKGPVKLSDVATFTRGEGPQVIERENRNRQIQIWAAPRGRSLGEIVADIQPKIAALSMPEGTSVAYDGEIRLMGETNENMGIALLLGVVFIYIVLASQYESFIHPFTIMLTLPLALVGAIFALFLAGHTMAMGAMIGILLLMGLVTKNAILLIDRAIARVREDGETPFHAVLEAGPERLRPILMTSAAMLLGMLPTAIGTGEGSEFRAPMAIAVIGGVISSTLLSLIVVPVFYLAIEQAREKLRGWFGGASA